MIAVVDIALCSSWSLCSRVVEHFGLVVGMSLSGHRGRRFVPRQQYVVSLSKTLYPHCFSQLISEMSTRWVQPRERCSAL